MGKNFIVGQSGGPTAVINASLAGVVSSALDICSDGAKIYGMRHGIQGFADGDIVELGPRLSDPAASELLKHTPAAALGSCRRRLPDPQKQPDVFEALFARLRQLDIGYFFYIGGNDSMDTIQKLSDYAQTVDSVIRFIGIPKTIDNDLALTDHTPGYGSAARYIACVMKELIADSLVYEEKRVTLVEIMGRNAGWLAGAAALSAGTDCPGPDLLYLPETPFDIDDFVARVEALQTKRKSVVVALSEGIKLEDGRYVCELSASDEEADVFGHRQLSGAAATLCSILKQRLGAKCRAIELSTMQRCAAHISSQTDVDEAFAAGKAGVEAAVAGKTGCMIVLTRDPDVPYRFGCSAADIHGIANAEKTVPLEWIDTEHATVTPQFIEYALPLIGGKLPDHFVL